MIWGRLPQRQDAQKIQQNFSVLTNEKFVLIHVHYRFLLQNGGRGIYFSAAIHYGFITVCKTAAGQPSNQGMKKLFAASKLPRKHRYKNKKTISQKTDGFGQRVIKGSVEIQLNHWFASSGQGFHSWIVFNANI